METNNQQLNTDSPRNGRRPLRVGFDLDGVLLYNPARIMRLPIATFKRIFVPKRKKKFLIPRSFISKIIWEALHLSSLFIAPGFDEIETLVKKGKITAYIVTGRYHFLDTNTKRWIDKLNRQHIFSGVHINIRDEQPHVFKARAIDELKLDIFIEDNWDIVEHLSKKTKVRILWIYNIFDRIIDYPHKFSNLKKAISSLKKNV